MKLYLLALIFCFGVFVAFAQEDKTAADYKQAGNEALEAKDYDKALQFYEQAMRRRGNAPKDTAMVYNMAVCYYHTRSYDKALKLLNESIAMNYKKQASLKYKTEIYQSIKDDGSYRKALEEALAASPDDQKIRSRLTTFYLKEANVHYAEGTKILKSASKYKTTDEPYKTALDKARTEFNKALPIVDKVLANDPDNETGKQLKEALQQNTK